MLVFSFLLFQCLSGFGITVILASQDELGSISFSSIFFKEFEKDWCEFFFTHLIEFTSETNWSWTFFP